MRETAGALGAPMRIRFGIPPLPRRGAVAGILGLATLGIAVTLPTAGCDDESSLAASPGSDTNLDATTPPAPDQGTPDDAGAANDTSVADASEAGADDASDDASASSGDSGARDASTADAATDVATDAALAAETGTGPDAADGGAQPKDAGSEAASNVVDATVVDADRSPDPGADAGTPTFTAIYTDIITPNCLSCHAQPPPLESMLFMGTQADAYNNLVNVRAMGDACMGSSPDGGSPIRVIPGDAADSLLYQKVTYTQACGSGMPEDSDSLTPFQLLTIETWINQGAAND
jgi:hypothetical protein